MLSSFLFNSCGRPLRCNAKYFLLLCTALLFCSTLLFAQGKNVVLLQGVLNDESGNTVKTELRFIDSQGKKTPAKTSSEGKYQVVLQPGESYTVLFYDWLPLEPLESLTFDDKGEYQEITKNFSLKKIIPGMPIADFCGFTANSAALSNTAQQEIKALKNLLDNNIKIIINIVITSEDSYFKPASKNEEYLDAKNKKKKRSVKVSAETQANDLLTQREETLKKLLIESGIRPTRFKIETRYIPGKPAKNAKGKKGENANSVNNIKNISISIARLMDL